MFLFLTIMVDNALFLKPDKLNSEERIRVQNILQKPKECPENHEDKEETDSSEQKTTPTIDVFLNPARSEELEDLLHQSEDGDITHTKVRNRNLTTCLLL